MNKTAKLTTSKDSSMGFNSPASREAPTVAMESLVSPLIAIEWPMTPAKSNQHKEKRQQRTVRPGKPPKPSAKIKAVKPLPEQVMG